MMNAMPQELFVRLSVFFGVFALMALLELLIPFRREASQRASRWPANIGIVVIDSLLVRLVAPAGAVSIAFFAETKGIGLLNSVALPGWAEVLAAVLVLDFAIWAQHLVFHKVPMLWRLHRMHHADTGYDVTTALRFHPIEILLSLGIKAAMILLIGAPALAVMIFEVLLNATAMFNHANVRLPDGLDRLLRLIVVTPGMHRVHHSTVQAETDSNYGFNSPWWDRLFGTYRAAPSAGEDGMVFGLETFRAPEERGFLRMLTQPFRASK